MSILEQGPLLELAVSGLREARAELEEARDQVSVIDARGRDLKISVDLESERRILRVLKAGSHYPVLAEESAGDQTDMSGRRWVVDPLDGSVNFYRGIPLYCIAIGLVEDGEPLLGVILDVERDVVYSGIVGVGAWSGSLDVPRKSAIRVGSIDDPASAVLATGLPVSGSFNAAALMGFIPWFQQFKKVRMFGSAATSLMFLASGRVDAYAEDGIKIWDVAAGVALVRAAGGHVDVESLDDTPHAVRVRAANSATLWSRVSGGRSNMTDGVSGP